MKHEFRAIISDMDGLLIDSEQLAWICWKAACEEFGYELFYENYLGGVGKGRAEFQRFLVELFDESFPSEEVALHRDRIGRAQLKESGMPLRPGSKEFLALLRQSGIPLGLATSTRKEEAEVRLLAAGIPIETFSAVCYGDEVRRLKPFPDVYLRVAELLSISPVDILVLEDTPTGASAALAAGMQVIIVPDLVASPKGIADRALMVVPTLNDVAERLEFPAATPPSVVVV